MTLRIVIVLLSLLVGAGKCETGSDDDGGVDAGRPASVDAAVFGELGGQCVSECSTAADCCSGPQCGSGIFQFRCDEGKCAQIGCRVDSDCTTELPTGRCGELGGFGLCAQGCNLPEDCCPFVPPGITFPDGVNDVTVRFDGGGQATFYKCGVYPQKFICNTQGMSPSDAGAGVCLRVCMGDSDCPGIPFPAGPDGGTVSVRVDGGMIAIPRGDAGTLRIFQQKCVAQFGPIGQCQKGCETNAECCPDPTGVTCSHREICVAGACVADGCRGNDECGGFGGGNSSCQPRAAP